MMTWSRSNISDRKARLPRDWDHKFGQRNRVLNRDRHACQWPMPNANAICGARATHVDHIAYGTSGPVPAEELQALCETHHNRKTAGEGGRATAARYGKRPRNPRRHPGLLDDAS